MKKTFWQRLKEVGPGAVVAAAFIGPGTITSCSLSGANYGEALLWAILFSTISVIIMQSMASRLGIVTGKGLGEALREKFTGKASRIILAVLVIAAVFIGNVAYETGNVSGAALGIVSSTEKLAVSDESIAEYIVKDNDGNITAISPKDKQETVYKNNGDGTYTHIDEKSGKKVTYKEDQIKNLIKNQVQTSDWKFIICAIAIGVVAFIILISSSNKYIEKILTGLVVIMGVLFLICAIAVKPDWLKVLKGLFIPSVPDSNGGDPAWMTVAALMGTTVVPYNIYLHASSSAKKWKNPEEDIKTSNLDSILAIGLGGVISLAIIVCASACKQTFAMENITFTIASGGDMAISLKPVLGSWATTIFGIGLLAAGFSSAITAPLAAAYATSGILGWGENLKKWKFRIIWMIVLAFGIVATCTLGASPQEIILFAQAANAFLLPITAILLLIAANDKGLMGKYKNGIVINILAVIVIGVFLFIATRNMTDFVNRAIKLFTK